MPCTLPVLSLLCCSCCGAAAEDVELGGRDVLRLAAFNVQVFGQKKISKPEVVQTLVNIAVEYDILLIQEIRDSKGTAIKKLLREIQKQEPNFDLIISTRLGRTHSKEQYAFFYRTDRDINIVGTYQDPDPQDSFERPPFSVKFRVPWLDVPEFVLAAIHVDPDTAVEEINALVPSHARIQQHWETENILILGDFNADGSYVSKSKLKTLDLRSPGFHWLIPDDTDTTVASSDLAYDRFVLTGEEFLQAVIPESVAVLRFDDKYDLDDEQARAVSDHFPIELSLRGQQQHAGGRKSSASKSGCGFFESIRNAWRRFRRGNDEL